MTDFYSIPDTKLKKSVENIYKNMKNTDSFKIDNETEHTVYKAISDDIFMFQYSPNQDILYNFVKEYDLEDLRKKNFCKLLNSYQFIPIKTIMEFAFTKCGSIEYSVNYDWFKLERKLRNNICIDISKISGSSFISLFGTLSLFFGKNNIKIKEIISDYDSSPDEQIDPDLDYWTTILINPKDFNPLGFIYDEITEVKNLRDTSSDDKEVKNTIKFFSDNNYIPWAIKAQNELYNWFMLMQSGFIISDIEENKNLKENQLEYEINIREKDIDDKIDFIAFLKKTFPCAQICVKRRRNLVKLLIYQDANKAYDMFEKYVLDEEDPVYA